MNATKEAAIKTVEWHDEDPFAVEGLLIFLYTARYPRDFIRISEPQSVLGDFEIHLKLLQIADKRHADGLKMQAANSLFYSGTNADCIVRCGKHTWNVHQAILCQRSRHLNSLFNGQFTSHPHAQEGQAKLVQWDDEVPFAIEALLIFLYTAHYDHKLIRCPKPPSSFTIHLKVLEIANKRLVDGLKAKATTQLVGNLQDCALVDDFVMMLQSVIDNAPNTPLMKTFGLTGAL
ncbi:MAG: hypothetical protein Q9160_008938 [Pyrenula sp. 1 TL-2023]